MSWNQETLQLMMFLRHLCCCHCLVAQLCPTLCVPVDCSTPGLPVPHETHIHRVSDAIQPSCPLCHLLVSSCHFVITSLSSPPALNLSQHQGLFQWVSLRIRWPKYWSFSISSSNEYSGLISIRIDWFYHLAVKWLSGVFSNTTVHKLQFFGAQPSLWSNSYICIWLLERP